MKELKNNYQKFDWEGIMFPISVTEIKSVTNHYSIPYESTIEIFRDDFYSLKGVLKGVTTNRDDLEYSENGVIKSVGFIYGEDLKVKSNGKKLLIKGFGISHTSETLFKEKNQIFIQFECQIYIESIELLCEDDKIPNIICDYFLGSVPKILFSNITRRNNNKEQFKFRDNFDNYIELNDDFKRGYKSSWDFSILYYKEEKIIIQQVHKEFLPNNVDGILIEYRNPTVSYPSNDFRKIVAEYLSFILGSHLQKIGSSTFNYNYELKSSKSNNPWSKKIFKNGNFNPIPLKNGLDRDFFEKIINKLFVNFVTQYQSISLSECLWKLWISQSQPLGVNLPTMSSGLESLIDSYLESNDLLKKYTKEEKREYTNLIIDELNSLEKKLEGFDFKNSLINKLKNPYNFTIGEKMKIFFNHISINFDKDSIENRALIARNLMAHQNINFDKVEDRERIKKLSDAYLSLINRVILKILEYDWYYIDYSKEGIHYLMIDENL